MTEWSIVENIDKILSYIDIRKDEIDKIEILFFGYCF